MTSKRRFTLSLALVAAGAVWFATSSGSARAPQAGVYLTPNGYRVPVYGMSVVRGADGRLEISCGQATNGQIESVRFGRSVSRAMSARSPRSTVQADTVTAAKFEIIYTDSPGAGFNDPQQGPARKRALEAAFAAWSKVLQGTIPIVVQARMEKGEDDDEDLLAVGGPVELVGLNDLAMPTSLASQILNEVVRREAADIEVVYNPDVDWDYAVSGAAVGEKSSFVYITLHEIAHGLGFIDSFVAETGELLNPIPFPYDTFVNRGMNSQNLVTKRSLEQIKGDLISKDLFFGGPKAVEASKKSIRPLPMIKLYAPDPYEPGSSVAHVDLDTYDDFLVGLMAPKVIVGTGADFVDTLTLAILEDMGYKLVPQPATPTGRRDKP